jgi:hypothetical protein
MSAHSFVLTERLRNLRLALPFVSWCAVASTGHAQMPDGAFKTPTPPIASTCRLTVAPSR